MYWLQFEVLNKILKIVPSHVNGANPSIPLIKYRVSVQGNRGEITLQCMFVSTFSIEYLPLADVNMIVRVVLFDLQKVLIYKICVSDFAKLSIQHFKRLLWYLESVMRKMSTFAGQ